MTTGRRLRIGVDTGGTFTDVVALDEATGTLTTTKTPSTPDDPARGFLAALVKVLGQLDAAPEAIAAVAHGTTVATNQLLEGATGALGLITNTGHEHLLEIARQSVPDGYGNSYFWVKPDRIVSADLVRGVGGRLDHTGAELRPFDTERAARVARWFADRGVTSIGICFLHAYANPAHEQAMAAILRAEHPTAAVSLSSDVLREYREYERAVTTLVDAAVKPRVAGYVSAIAGRLADLTGRPEPPVPFSIMKSNGGVLSAAEIVHQPISTVLSGPAAGALGAAFVARAAGFDRVLTLDGGGTSTDVSVVLDGAASLTSEGSVGSYPTRIPMVDVVTVGAGGGSIAWLSPESALRVGPRSAGAAPGPICYQAGGTEPTVTDAHLVLGRIPPHLLGGEMPLDVEAARAGIARLGERLDLDAAATARGILEISAWNQANALRQVSVRRGLDVRDFSLVTFGGSGSLLACRLAEIVGLAHVLVPPDPGNLSAFGLLTVDVRVDEAQTAVQPHDHLDHDRTTHIYADLTARVAKALAAEGFPTDRARLSRSADLRYAGQAYEVRVGVPDGDLDPGRADTVVERFHAAHRALYGYAFEQRPDQRVEWVGLRVSGVGPIPAPRLPRRRPTGRHSRTGIREVVFDESGPIETAIHDRGGLSPGAVVQGPAIIEEYGSTVPVHPGFACRLDDLGNLLIGRVAAEGHDEEGS